MYKKNHLGSKQSLRRSPPTRSSKIPALVISEDSRTAPTYFEIFKAKFQLSHLHIDYRKSEGMRLVELLSRAEEIHRRHDNRYGKIYIVFDKDTHSDFEIVQQKIKKSKLKTREGDLVEIVAIIVIPCFEYWLLLHLTQTDRPFESSMQLKRELNKLGKQKYGYEYEKDLKKFFSEIITVSNLLSAMSSVRKSRQSSEINNQNPYTNIDQLVQSFLNPLDNAGIKNTQFCALAHQIALTNPDLPIEFIKEILISRGQERSSVEFFLPAEKLE